MKKGIMHLINSFCSLMSRNENHINYDGIALILTFAVGCLFIGTLNVIVFIFTKTLGFNYEFLGELAYFICLPIFVTIYIFFTHYLKNVTHSIDVKSGVKSHALYFILTSILIFSISLAILSK